MIFIEVTKTSGSITVINLDKVTHFREVDGNPNQTLVLFGGAESHWMNINISPKAFLAEIEDRLKRNGDDERV